MLDIKEPLMEFLKRCATDYRIGDTQYYEKARESREKHCYNPFLATEMDVQVKLGGIIDAFIKKAGIPFSLNSELPVYSQYPNAKADLSIHRIEDGLLYTKSNSHIENLELVIEIKYGNAQEPDYDFEMGNVQKDFDKLNSLGSAVKKIFVYIDEADRTLEKWSEWLISQSQKDILLITNNKNIINQYTKFNGN